jgi:hypothetical protein
MKPIWYFVGLIMIVIGTIIFLTGIYHLINPPAVKTILFETYPNLWWGLIMVLFGGIMFLKTRKQIV